MAKIKCPECGKKIDNSLTTCPHCGYPLSEEERRATQNNQNTKSSTAKDGMAGDWIQNIKENYKSYLLGAIAIVAAIFVWDIIENGISDLLFSDEKETVKTEIETETETRKGKNSNSFVGTWTSPNGTSFVFHLHSDGTANCSILNGIEWTSDWVVDEGKAIVGETLRDTPVKAYIILPDGSFYSLDSYGDVSNVGFKLIKK